MLSDIEDLSVEDKFYIEKGGVIIRPKGSLEIECITRAVPYWHIHAATKTFDDKISRDVFFKKMLAFADYKELIIF